MKIVVADCNGHGWYCSFYSLVGVTHIPYIMHMAQLNNTLFKNHYIIIHASLSHLSSKNNCCSLLTAHTIQTTSKKANSSAETVLYCITITLIGTNVIMKTKSTIIIMKTDEWL
jgi:hypothetical protein